MNLTLKNFRLYTPEHADFMIPGYYFESEDGLDWYYHRTRFKSDSIKIGYDKENVIRTVTLNAESIYPAGLTITELPPELVPPEVDNSGNWSFKGGQIINNLLDSVSQTKNKREQLLSEARQIIEPLQMEVLAGIISEEDLSIFKCWVLYAKQLRELDLSSPVKINWPLKPE